MTKLFSGSSLSYGTRLPLASSLADGTFFYLTETYTDNVNASGVVRGVGLYLCSFLQDSNSSVLGDQVGFGWTQVTSTGVFVAKTGDTMSGALKINTGLNSGVLNLAGATQESRIVLGNANSLGAPGPAIILSSQREIRFGFGNDHNDITGGTFSTSVIITTTGMSVGANQVWHAGNDGSGSTLDADLLDGQQGTFYSNRANHTGTQDISSTTTGTLGLTRGGTGTTVFAANSLVYSSGTALVPLAASTAGFVLQTNGAGLAPSWVSQSTLSVGSASTANQLTTARTIGLSGVTSTPTSFNGTSNITIPVTAVPTSLLTGTISPSQLFGGDYTVNSLSVQGVGNVLSVSNGIVSQSIYTQQILVGFNAGAPITSIQATGQISTSSIVLASAVEARNYNLLSVGYLRLIGHSGPEQGYMEFFGGNNIRAGYIGNGVQASSTDTGMIQYVAGNHWFNNTLTAQNVSINGNTNATGTITTNGILTVNNQIICSSTITASGSGLFSGNIQLRNSAPTLIMRDTDNLSAFLHINANTIYFLRGAGADADTWDSGPNGRHPMELNLSTGNVVFSGNVTAFSDARLKENVEPIQNAVDKVKAIRGVTYNRIGSVKREMGVIAQEVEAVAPEVIAESNDGMKTVAYGNLVGLLLSAIAEQQKQIDDLVAKVESLQK